MKRLVLVFFIGTFTLSIDSQSSIPKIEPETLEYKSVDTIKLYLHLYKPDPFDESIEYSCIVFFHGGGWNNGSYKAFQRHSRYLASRGMIAISADYRVRDLHGTTPFEAVEDAKSAIRFIRKNSEELHVNPNKIVAGGGSAGGHLAAVCGNIDGLEGKNEDLRISSRPNALVLFNPVYDNSKNGFGYARMDGRFLEISPLHNIKKGAPPTIIFFGTKDKTTPVTSSKSYEKKMKDVGSRCELFLYEGAEHSFFYKKEYFADTVIKMDKFLQSLDYLKGEPTI